MSDTTNTRTELNDLEARVLATKLIEEYETQDKSFTIQDVVSTLRSRHPDLEIDRDQMRDVIPGLMSANPAFVLTYGRFNGYSARQWVPASQAPAPTPAPVLPTRSNHPTPNTAQGGFLSGILGVLGSVRTRPTPTDTDTE